MASINPLAILDGKNPGAMELQRMCRGPSSIARLRARWIAAALEVEYPKTTLSPLGATDKPPVEAVTMTLEGDSSVARFCRRGANCRDPVNQVSHQLATFFRSQVM